MSIPEGISARGGQSKQIISLDAQQRRFLDSKAADWWLRGDSSTVEDIPTILGSGDGIERCRGV